MKYAVVEIKGKQYKISEGEEFLVSYLGEDKPVARVLLLVDGEKSKIGKPVVDGVKIGLKVVKDEEKGEKVYVKKFKAKSRYRRKTGFRPKYTRLLVQKIA